MKKGISVTYFTQIILFSCLLFTTLICNAQAIPGIDSGEVKSLKNNQQHKAKKASPEDVKAIQTATAAVLGIYSYDYDNYEDAIGEAKKYFTEQGWNSFKRAFDASNNLAIVKEQKFKVSAAIEGKAMLISQSHSSEQNQWYVQLPLKVTYTNPDNKKIHQYLMATALIVKGGPDDELGVQQIVLEPRAKN